MRRYKSLSGEQLIIDTYNKLLASWGIDFEERNIETTYGSTHVIIAGDKQKPPLLLFHGTADNSAMMWIYNATVLSQRFYIIAVDAIGGSGKSEPNDKYIRNFDQLSWIDEILDILDIHTTNICGVSYGAYLAYYYTLKRPNKVNKAVCLAGRIPSSHFEVFSKMMLAFLPEALFPSEQNCRKLLRKLCGSNFSKFEENEVLMHHWYYLLKYFDNKSMMHHRIKISSDTELSQMREKVLFLIGEYDRLSNYPKAIKRIENNKINFKIIKNAGHALNHEQAELINREIIEFIE